MSGAYGQSRIDVARQLRDLGDAEPTERTTGGARDRDLVHALIAWEKATDDGTEIIGDLTVTVPTGTYGVPLTQRRADRLRWTVLADAQALTAPKPED